MALMQLLLSALLLCTCSFNVLAAADYDAHHNDAIDTTSANDGVRRFDFHVKYTNFTRLCRTKQIVTVNDQFPGPMITVHEGERVLLSVTNDMPDKNITIHWHGVRQLRTGWFDGPAYITQCPIMPGRSFVYNFTVTGQRGTLWWHAHISWMRSTVHGAFVILPKPDESYPFPQPAEEIPLVLGEWWNSDTQAVIAQALQTGAGPNVSDAYTINGQPGAMYNCSSQDAFKLAVRPHKTYLLRIVNACLNDELFLSIANHTLTVVEIDATYTKPFTTNTILLAPGQTTNVLLTADQASSSKYILAVRAYNSAGPTVPFDNTTGSAVVEYIEEASEFASSKTIMMPTLPAYNDTSLANSLSASIKSINSEEFPTLVPKSVDRNLLFTVGLARKACPQGQQCQGPSGGKFSAAMNNISFILPSTSLLQSFFVSPEIAHTTGSNESNRVFPTTFPDEPTSPFNYTGAVQPQNIAPQVGTRLSWIRFNASVQLVLQGTSILGTESHPIHLHGYNFFVVGQGTGNFNSSSDPATFNLVDPPERNTIGVPKGGWVALRFRADNPGVWFMHCHLEVHTSWGLETAFLVTNGKEPDQTLEPPPTDLPSC
ncbi:hypothetical protein GOP47_0001401 [Adiantum capillus-veneris]|uniref:Laccase n=1 Tax=Adiantum capillus-veneris TaxID=13818 RepID=A0A9D4V8M2_ADICA|nr:hypothetical protein GOP47_0001401 [Adiantum capillus-veneris]